MKARSPSVATRPDLAAIVSQVLLEHPPKSPGPAETMAWVRRTWPGITEDEVVRAMRIAFELLLADTIVPAGE